MSANKVLLAEDDRLTRFMMSEMLAELDCDFDICENGDQALGMVIENPAEYALILMDVHMPVVTGVEAMTRIRAVAQNPPRDIPIVAVTADQQWQNSSKCVRAGFDDVLPKPISLDNLRKKIDRYTT